MQWLRHHFRHLSLEGVGNNDVYTYKEAGLARLWCLRGGRGDSGGGGGRRAGAAPPSPPAPSGCSPLCERGTLIRTYQLLLSSQKTVEFCHFVLKLGN